jgi:hypothetical protein
VPFFLPADSLTPGAKRAQEARWAAVGNRDHVGRVMTTV